MPEKAFVKNLVSDKKKEKKRQKKKEKWPAGKVETCPDSRQLPTFPQALLLVVFLIGQKGTFLKNLKGDISILLQQANSVP